MYPTKPACELAIPGLGKRRTAKLSATEGQMGNFPGSFSGQSGELVPGYCQGMAAGGGASCLALIP